MKKTIIFFALTMSFVHAEQTCNSFIDKSTPLEQFAFFENGTRVTDKSTGLVWARCLEGQVFNDNNTPTVYLDDSCDGEPLKFLRQDALSHSKARVDYRMPNIKELASTVELQCASPAVNSIIFPNQPNNWVWSSTFIASKVETGISSALSINFETGVVGFNGSANSSLRLIRYKNLLTS